MHPTLRRFAADPSGVVRYVGRLNADGRHAFLKYSFKEIRRELRSEPGIYLVEALGVELDVDPALDAPAEQSPLWFYIGTSSNLERRFAEHEARTSPLVRNLDQYLGGGDAWLAVSVQREQSIGHEGESPEEPDLSSSLARVLFEHAAIADYRREHPGTPMVNIDGRRDEEPPPSALSDRTEGCADGWSDDEAIPF